jgi:hypothetical protein
VQEAGKPLRRVIITTHGLGLLPPQAGSLISAISLSRHPQVIMIHSGSASVHGGPGADLPRDSDGRTVGLAAADFPPSSLGGKLYTYKGDGRNGCVIGGTALGDSSVLDRSYPNHIVCDGPTKCMEWDVHELLQLLKHDRVIESAFLHSLYVELISGLRRHRKGTSSSARFNSTYRCAEPADVPDCIKERPVAVIAVKPVAVVASKPAADLLDSADYDSDKLQRFDALLRHAIRLPVVQPLDKLAVIEFAQREGISQSLHDASLRKLGWTPQSWACSSLDTAATLVAA